ncbi:MAG: dTDP-4-dehydrorhamnose reductase [Robiginitomaculum sp.]|nr:MAG: dTDP-4-dehydrorhamnose reductase [Robiginitomaculum sp.]
MSKVLVIGAHGQVARSLFTVEKPASFELFSVARPELDLARPETIAPMLDVQNPQFLINAAAYTQVDAAQSNEAEAFAVNAEGVDGLAKECAKRNIVLLHLSTDYVYDGTKQGPYTETDPTAPLGVYGRSKLAGEDAIRAAGGSHLILRTAWVHSPYGRNFVKTMLRLAESNGQINVINDQTGCPTFAPHLASGILQIIDRLNRSGKVDHVWGTYCMAGSGNTSWYEFAREIFEQSKRCGGPTCEIKPIPATEWPTPTQRPENSKLDCQKIEQQFGIRLPHWRQGVAKCVADILA